MANVVPAVVTDVGEQGSCCGGGDGYLIPLNDDVAMARIGMALLVDHALTLQCGVKARERVEPAFSLTGMVEAYCRLYE